MDPVYGVGDARNRRTARAKEIASQLALLRVLYLPLEETWPDTFSEEKLEKTARTLTDSAHGLWVAVLRDSAERTPGNRCLLSPQGRRP